MTENGVKSGKCRFCKSSFSNEILKKIGDDRNDVYCENCGDLIKRVQNGYINEPKTITKAKRNIPFVVKEPPQELLIDPDALLYPNGRVFYDTDFPQIFKSNFIIVFARLVYFHALRLKNEENINLEELVITENIVNEIHKRISPIHDKRIKAEFVKNLHKITLNEFELNLKKLQRKFHENMQYREDFIIYSRWLIKRVLTIISEKKNVEQLTKFERTILTDINNLNENSNVNNMTEILVMEKIQESVKKYEENKILYDDFLYYNLPNFLNLKKNGNYDKLITQFKKTRRRALILKKGFVFSESFKSWLTNESPNFSEHIKKIDDNFEILQYILYELIEESKKPINERKFLKEIATSIGVSPSTITNFGKKLGELGIIDYNSKFSLKTIKLKEDRFFSRDLGLIYHEVINNFLTIYFRKAWNAKFYAEPYIFKPISLEHPDGLIILKFMSKTFQNFFSLIFNRIFPDLMSFKGYDYILFDYTSLISKENVKTKLNKYYPPYNTLLLIIGFNLDKNNMEYQEYSDIPFNVKVISPSLLAKLIHLNLPNNNNFQKIFDIINSAISNNDYKKLNRISEKTKTELNKTEILIRDLKTSNLSSIFSFTNKSSVFIQQYVEIIQSDIKKLVKKFKLNSDIEKLAKNIIEIIYKDKEISLSYDYTGYVGSTIYASSKFLLNKIKYEDLTAFLKISSTPLNHRLNDIKGNPKLIFGLLIHVLIKKILKLLKIKDENIEEKIFEIIELLYEYYLSSLDKTIAFCVTIVYLVVNRYNKSISQREICEILNYNNRSGITSILEDLTQLREILLNFGIDCENIKKKRIREELIDVLKEKGALTTEQIIHEIGFDCRRHLKNLLNDKKIEKELRYIGKANVAFWKLPNININMNLFDPRREKVINMLANHQFLTTNEISDYLNEDTKTIYKYLCKLEEKKLIKKNVKREGKTFRAYWKLE